MGRFYHLQGSDIASNTRINMTQVHKAYKHDGVSLLTPELDLEFEFDPFEVRYYGDNFDTTITNGDGSFFKIIVDNSNVSDERMHGFLSATGIVYREWPSYLETVYGNVSNEDSLQQKKVLCGRLFYGPSDFLGNGNFSPNDKRKYPSSAGIQNNYLVQVSGTDWVDASFDWYNCYAINKDNELYRWGNAFDLNLQSTDPANSTYPSSPQFVSGDVLALRGAWAYNSSSGPRASLVLDIYGRLYQIHGNNNRDPELIADGYQFTEFSKLNAPYVVDVSGDVYSVAYSNQGGWSVNLDTTASTAFNQTSVNPFTVPPLTAMQGTGIMETFADQLPGSIGIDPAKTFILSELRQSQLFPIIPNEETPYIEYLRPNFITHSGYLMIKGYQQMLTGFYEHTSDNRADLSSDSEIKFLTAYPMPSAIDMLPQSIQSNWVFNDFNYSTPVAESIIPTTSYVYYFTNTVAFISGVNP